jgi:hypothetical protein
VLFCQAIDTIYLWQHICQQNWAIISGYWTLFIQILLSKIPSRYSSDQLSLRRNDLYEVTLFWVIYFFWTTLNGSSTIINTHRHVWYGVITNTPEFRSYWRRLFIMVISWGSFVINLSRPSISRFMSRSNTFPRSISLTLLLSKKFHNFLLLSSESWKVMNTNTNDAAVNNSFRAMNCRTSRVRCSQNHLIVVGLLEYSFVSIE